MQAMHRSIDVMRGVVFCGLQIMADDAEDIVGLCKLCTVVLMSWAVLFAMDCELWLMMLKVLWGHTCYAP